MTEIKDPEELERVTIEHYSSSAEAWEEENFEAYPDAFGDAFDANSELLGERPLILDIGCGTGRALTLFSLKRMRYIGVDPAQGMLDIARKRYPDADFRLGDARRLPEIVPETCDAFLACASLNHVARAHLPDALNALRKVLRLGALGCLTVPNGNKEVVLTSETSRLIVGKNKVYISCYTRDTLTPELERANFEVINAYEPDPYAIFFTVKAV